LVETRVNVLLVNQRISQEERKTQENLDKKLNKLDERAIGVFDSGLGGLTLVRSLKQALPGESIVYLGDSARVPYGSKSSATIQAYARQAIDFLLTKDVKYIVVACNSASANLLPDWALDYGVPIVGVIDVTARAAVKQSKTHHIGVLGTLATVSSNAYTDRIRALNKDIKCSQLACPLFVPLAEEGWVDKAVTNEIIREYLAELAEKAADIDQLILGCTHYPLLKRRIADQVNQLFDQSVALVDSALESAKGVAVDLIDKGLASRSVGDSAGDQFYFTDASRFEELAVRFLGYVPARVEYVDL